jgi:hypothetical protein
MDIHQLSQRSGLTPEESNRVTEAYQRVLQTLCVKDRETL